MSFSNRVTSLVRKLGYHSKPNFIIIGAQKSGTSSLFYTLKQHPKIIAPNRKELHYFDDRRIQYGDFLSYHNHFPLPHQLKGKLTFEATPSYLFCPHAAERIFNYSPQIKLIVLLREPVARAFSAYNFFCSFQNAKNENRRKIAEWRSFEEAIDAELSQIETSNWQSNPVAYVKRGIYVDQLEHYYKFFRKDQILVLDYQSYKKQFHDSMNSICTFLNIDQSFPFQGKTTNVTRYSSNLPEDIKKKLSSFYEPHNKRLFTLLNTQFDW